MGGEDGEGCSGGAGGQGGSGDAGGDARGDAGGDGAGDVLRLVVSLFTVVLGLSLLDVLPLRLGLRLPNVLHISSSCVVPAPAA